MDYYATFFSYQFIDWASLAKPYFNLYNLGINYSLIECHSNISCDLSQEGAITSLVQLKNVRYNH